MSKDLYEALADVQHESGYYEIDGMLYDREGEFVTTVELYEKEKSENEDTP